MHFFIHYIIITSVGVMSPNSIGVIVIVVACGDELQVCEPHSKEMFLGLKILLKLDI